MVLIIVIIIISNQKDGDAVNWKVYVTIVSAFGIGQSLVSSGMAKGVVNWLVFVGIGLGIRHAGLFGAVYFDTF